MGGTVAVASEPGTGSTFTFTARFTRSSGFVAVPKTKVADLVAHASAARRAASLRILVAEDNELNSTLLRTLLSKRGHRAWFACDGRTAVEMTTHQTFDLVLLDLHMPEMDGFAVVRAIRERERATGTHLPVIALTARSSKGDRDRCLAAGMDDFLSKPIEADALWAAMANVIARATS